jgi:ABC-type antimicrobial peptide transport system permease subunit
MTGVAGALAVGRRVAALLYGVSVHDPAIYLTAALLLGLVAVAAALLPALRASRVDPIDALRA